MERQKYSIKALSFACVLSSLLLFEGCTSKRPPTGIRFPITHGFHAQIPSEHHRILIWGDPLLTKTTEEWLRSHHDSHILVPSQNPHQALGREALLALAGDLRADFVLLLEREELKTGALIESPCDAGFNLSVTVRGLLPGNGETVFRGSAYYPHCVERTHEIVKNLTCQALATAWGFRPSGQLEIPSSLACTAGQITPASIR